MAQKSSIAQDEPSLEPKQASQLLRKQCDKGRMILAERPISGATEKAWETVTRDILGRAFGSSSPNVSAVMNVGMYSFTFGGGTETEWEEQRANDMEERLEIIEGLIELLESNAELESPTGQGSTSNLDSNSIQGNKVFLVHGHNEEIIHETARFLESLDLDVVILREQPNSGRTIIEKFFDYSDVSFAVVLLTGDDRGGKFVDTYDEQNPRGRQNVILELGFFLGKLGRDRVCALYEEGVEIPSDYSGVLFINIDSNGAWRLSLARELKSNGLDIDMNKAL